MRMTPFRRVTAVAEVVAALAVAGIAFGFSSSLGVLADSNTVNKVNFNDDAIKLRTKDPTSR
jgi:hypothetical protein